jgi:hypothetical protein
MMENLRERRIVVVDRCCLWKVSMEITDIPPIRRNIAKDLLSFVLYLFRILRTMPRTVFNYWHAGWDSLEDTVVARYGRLFFCMLCGVFGESKMLEF